MILQQSMVFLEDLMELEEPVNKGIELSFSSQSFIDRLIGKKEADKYFLHRSKGGLPLVLPHEDNGDLYSPRTSWGASLQKKKSISLPHDFKIFCCWALVRNEQRFKAEKIIGKKFPTKISYAATLKEGKISSIELSYMLDKERNNKFKEGASFTVYYPLPSVAPETGEIKDNPKIAVAGGGICIYSDIGEVSFNARKDGTVVFHLPDGLSDPKPVDYNRTMQNLVSLLLNDDFNLRDLYHLRFLDYFSFLSWV